VIRSLIQFLKIKDKIVDICPACYATIIRAMNLKKKASPNDQRRKRRNSGHESLRAVLG
jgi:hypothetical protein